MMDDDRGLTQNTAQMNDILHWLTCYFYALVQIGATVSISYLSWTHLHSLALTCTTHSVSSFFCLFLRRIVETFRCRVSTLLSEVSFWGYDDLWHEMDRQIEETPMPLECRRTTKRSSREDVATRRTPLQIPIRSIRLQKEDSR